jgi:hypothetical protein
MAVRQLTIFSRLPLFLLLLRRRFLEEPGSSLKASYRGLMTRSDPVLEVTGLGIGL